ncbi:MAG: hypothetical protein D6722_08265 [Bacteroidetes bacterium]|nr:MAG: hypothetical protein D6722_08265 [Bacteroidota bacterium]
MEEGGMQTAGLQAIARAKAEGLWDFMEDVDNLVIPEDLAQALAGNQEARLFFEGINASSKRFVLRWIKLAKTAETRQSRIEKIVALSAEGKKLPGS